MIILGHFFFYFSIETCRDNSLDMLEANNCLQRIKKKIFKNYRQIFLHTLRICLFDLGLTSLSTSFSHILTVSGSGRELNAHF